MKRAQARLRLHIQNLINECHKKVALWFLLNFDVIIIPPFNGSAMSRRLNRKINSKTVCKMLTWAHSRFCNRLVFKAEELGKKVIIQNEAYTSKTCRFVYFLFTFIFIFSSFLISICFYAVVVDLLNITWVATKCLNVINVE